MKLYQLCNLQMEFLQLGEFADPTDNLRETSITKIVKNRLATSEALKKRKEKNYLMKYQLQTDKIRTARLTNNSITYR